MKTKEIATQHIRRDRTGLPEGAVPEGVSAETIRAAIFYDTDGRFGAFRCAYRCRGDPIPRRVQGTGRRLHCRGSPSIPVA